MNVITHLSPNRLPTAVEPGGRKDVNETNPDGKYIFFSCSPDTFKSKEYICDDDAIIIVGNGSYTGTVRYYSGKFDLYQRTYACVLKDIFKGEYDLKFVFYYTKRYFERNFMGGTRGSSIPYIVRGDISNFKIPDPPITEQKSISKVLSTFDDKIELLQAQNKTLENIAQALFKRWFIDFEFPDEQGNPYKSSGGEMVDSELGAIPEEWKVGSLEDVTLRITDGSHFSPKTFDSGYPMASVKDMTDWGIDINGCRKISHPDYNDLVRSDCKPLKNDILIAKDGSFLKHIFLVPEDLDVVVLSSIAIIRSNGSYAPILLTNLLKSDVIMKQLGNIVSGAVIRRIVLKDFRKFKIVIPTGSVQLQAQNILNPIYEKCWNNNSQIQTLSTLRDTLLPKLMSGDIRITRYN